MDFLQITGKNFLIMGVANKKSVATHVAKALLEMGAKVFFTVQHNEAKKQVEKIFPQAEAFICNVENPEDIDNLSLEIQKRDILFHGILHSLAFANFSDGPKPFHETKRKDFLQATQISCFSLVEVANALKGSLDREASVVTLSISNLRATNYGYMGPIKACLNATVYYLAKSFSEFSNIRFNSIGSGPLKTSASAGIPNYIENYLYAEQLTLRKKALQTQEVANLAAFLLSPRASGINAENYCIDAGMNSNYFDQEIVKNFSSQT